jgi:hypothetical protein
MEEIEKIEKIEKTSVKKSGKKKEEKIGDALMKVALGYQIAEVTEEYAEVNGELKLTKRKKTKKDVPPDLKAVQLLLSSGESGDLSGWTDEQLQAEKKRLLAQLRQEAASVVEKVGAETMADGREKDESLGEGARSKAKSVAKKTAVKKAAKKKTVKKSNAKAQAKGTRSVAVKKGGEKEDGAKGV